MPGWPCEGMPGCMPGWGWYAVIIFPVAGRDYRLDEAARPGTERVRESGAADPARCHRPESGRVAAATAVSRCIECLVHRHRAGTGWGMLHVLGGRRWWGRSKSFAKPRRR
jgi:hypothetical protein